MNGGQSVNLPGRLGSMLGRTVLLYIGTTVSSFKSSRSFSKDGACFRKYNRNYQPIESGSFPTVVVLCGSPGMEMIWISLGLWAIARHSVTAVQQRPEPHYHPKSAANLEPGPTLE